MKAGSPADRSRQSRARGGHSRVSAEHFARAADAGSGGARGAASLFADRQLAADTHHPGSKRMAWRVNLACRRMSACATGIPSLPTR